MRENLIHRQGVPEAMRPIALGAAALAAGLLLLAGPANAHYLVGDALPPLDTPFGEACALNPEIILHGASHGDLHEVEHGVLKVPCHGHHE